MPYAGSSLGEGFRMAKQIAIGLVTTLVLACLPAGTEAQDRPVRLNGRVQWIAGPTPAAMTVPPRRIPPSPLVRAR